MPCLRHRSLADIPAACSFSTLMICSSVNLPLRIVCLLAGEQNPNLKSGAFQGSRSQGVSKMKRFTAIDTRDTTVFDVVVAKDLITATCQMYERVHPQHGATFPSVRLVSSLGTSILICWICTRFLRIYRTFIAVVAMATSSSPYRALTASSFPASSATSIRGTSKKPSNNET